jgi:hypothetical protein
VSAVGVAVSVGHLLEGIAAIDERFEDARFGELGERANVFRIAERGADLRGKVVKCELR